MSRRLLRCGEHAVMVELDGLEEVLALDGAVRAAVEGGDAAFADLQDVVPAARTLLLVVREGADITPVRDALRTLASPPGPRPNHAAPPAPGPDGPPTPDVSLSRPAAAAAPSHSGRPQVVEIPVHYDGPDLEEVADLTGLTPQEVVVAHTGTPWRVAFAGFSPGFAYLFGGDPRLQVPRRDEPRTSVPAGSVGLAGEFSAVYPRSSPGGWQLLGHTDATLWDVDRTPPALLQPGMVVRFVDVDLRAGEHLDAGAVLR